LFNLGETNLVMLINSYVDFNFTADKYHVKVSHFLFYRVELTISVSFSGDCKFSRKEFVEEKLMMRLNHDNDISVEMT